MHGNMGLVLTGAAQIETEKEARGAGVEDDPISGHGTQLVQ